MNRTELEAIATQIVDAAFEVHKTLGVGLLESAYEMALCHELAIRRLTFERQKAMPVVYKGVRLDLGYRLDLLVAEQIVVEIKAVESLVPIFEAQLLNYLNLGSFPLGFLINFNSRRFKEGFKRFVRQLPS